MSDIESEPSLPGTPLKAAMNSFLEEVDPNGKTCSSGKNKVFTQWIQV